MNATYHNSDMHPFIGFAMDRILDGRPKTARKVRCSHYLWMQFNGDHAPLGQGGHFLLSQDAVDALREVGILEPENYAPAPGEFTPNPDSFSQRCRDLWVQWVAERMTK